MGDALGREGGGPDLLEESENMGRNGEVTARCKPLGGSGGMFPREILQI